VAPTGYERSFDAVQPKRTWSNCSGGRYCRISMRLICAWKDLLGEPGRRSSAKGEVLAVSRRICCWVLCLHAAKHLWTRLIWLSDIAETCGLTLGTRPSTTRWRFLGRALWGSLAFSRKFLLVENVTSAEIPKSAKEIIAADARGPPSERIRERLARGATYDFESTNTSA